MRYQAEVVVIGAGPGGICAALSAARENRKTILITNRPVLGGNSSSEIRVWTRGATGAGSFFAEEMGVWGEMKLRNLYVNPDGNPVFWDDVLLDTVLAEPNLTLFLNTHITAVSKNDRRIEYVSGFQMASEMELEFYGDVYIDATGDGSIGAASGVPYRTGKESRAEYGESYAPETEAATTQGNTILYFTSTSDHPVVYKAPGYAYSIEQIEEFLDRGGRIINEKMNGCDYWWFETGGEKDTIKDSQAIAMDLKKLVAGVWNYIKNSGKFDADNLTLTWQGNLPGKRESRRMLTEWVVRQQDVEARVAFEDAAFYGGWYIDFHPAGGVHTEEDFCIQIPLQVYSMPFRCLYNRTVENLFFAGRDIGTSHVAFASSRIMNTCAMSGQAAGTLAAYCAGRKKIPAELEKADLDALQIMLINNDMLLPGIHKPDPDNLALQARVSASSVERTGMTAADSQVTLGPDNFLIIPSAAGSVEVCLEAAAETELRYECHGFALPSKLALQEPLSIGRTLLEPGTHWYHLSLPDADSEQFYLLVIKAADQVRIRTGERQLTGFLGGDMSSAAYWFPCIRFGNPELYSEQQLLNGYNRPWNSPNLWISGAEEQPYVIYEWNEPVEIRKLLLFFNSDLSGELNSSRASSWNDHHMFQPRNGMPPQLVKDVEIYAHQGGTWQLLGSITDNWRRKCTVQLEEPAVVSKLKIQIVGTYGAKHGELFDVCIY